MKLLLLSFMLICTQYTSCGNVKDIRAKEEKKTAEPPFSTSSLLNFY